MGSNGSKNNPSRRVAQPSQLVTLVVELDQMFCRRLCGRSDPLQNKRYKRHSVPLTGVPPRMGRHCNGRRDGLSRIEPGLHGIHQ